MGRVTSCILMGNRIMCDVFHDWINIWHSHTVPEETSKGGEEIGSASGKDGVKSARTTNSRKAAQSSFK